VTEDKARDLIINAHAEFVSKYSGKYEMDDLAYFIAIRYFEAMDLRLFNEEIFDENDTLVATDAKATYDMDEFKINFKVINPLHYVITKLNVKGISK